MPGCTACPDRQPNCRRRPRSTERCTLPSRLLRRSHRCVWHVDHYRSVTWKYQARGRAAPATTSSPTGVAMTVRICSGPSSSGSSTSTTRAPRTLTRAPAPLRPQAACGAGPARIPPAPDRLQPYSDPCSCTRSTRRPVQATRSRALVPRRGRVRRCASLAGAGRAAATLALSVHAQPRPDADSPAGCRRLPCIHGYEGGVERPTGATATTAACRWI